MIVYHFKLVGDIVYLQTNWLTFLQIDLAIGLHTSSTHTLKLPSKRIQTPTNTDRAAAIDPCSLSDHCAVHNIEMI